MGDVASFPERSAGSEKLPRVVLEELPQTVVPLDYAILALLPEEGSMLGKYHQMGRTAKDMVESLDDEYVTSSTVNSRLRVLRMNKLAVHVPGSANTGGGRKVWQRTPLGKALVMQGEGA